MIAFLSTGKIPERLPIISIPGSKSVSNRLLILQARYPAITIENISDSDDTKAIEKALQDPTGTVNIGHAGTAMRFLTAYFASQEGSTVLLTGSERMQQRPIEPLVTALQKLGASISYKGKKGYPPLAIEGKALQGGTIEIDASISSQFLSALLLVAPSFKNGLQLHLKGTITSRPYLEMTLSLLQQLDIAVQFNENTISILPKKEVSPTRIAVEPDWSSASYFYSTLALLPKPMTFELLHFSETSLQGDAVLSSIYKSFGVSTTFTKSGMFLRNDVPTQPSEITLDLIEQPDLAQTIVVTALGLGKSCIITGLHTLKIKETDRLQALQNEIKKLGATVTITDDSIRLEPIDSLTHNCTIATYHDHRMAMAFAPLAAKVSIQIENPQVVTKSFTTFWKELEKVGISVTFQE